jgi:CubicO group peptidase (beta-lactamase class C family)
MLVNGQGIITSKLTVRHLIHHTSGLNMDHRAGDR